MAPAGWCRPAASSARRRRRPRSCATWRSRNGVPDERIVVEDRAKNTFENALYTGLIIRRRGWQRVVVVTDAFHMPRALYVYRRLGLRVTGDPVRTRQPGSLPTRLRLYAREALAFARCAWLFRVGRHKAFVAAVWGE